MRAEHPRLTTPMSTGGFPGTQPERRFLVRGLVDHFRAPGCCGCCRTRSASSSPDVLMTVLDGVSEAGAAGWTLPSRSHRGPDVSEDPVSERSRQWRRSRCGTTLLAVHPPVVENPLVFAVGLPSPTARPGTVLIHQSCRSRSGICDNGMMLTKHAHREVHLGGSCRRARSAGTRIPTMPSLVFGPQCTATRVATFLSEGFELAGSRSSSRTSRRWCGIPSR
ncbi:hypothetical protein HBB16_13350 [Pseudonocardia sp. MCCB 268]|nr:hypothetical protein [Pseudonocardia cytotoxica]